MSARDRCVTVSRSGCTWGPSRRTFSRTRDLEQTRGLWEREQGISNAVMACAPTVANANCGQRAGGERDVRHRDHPRRVHRRALRDVGGGRHADVPLDRRTVAGTRRIRQHRRLRLSRSGRPVGRLKVAGGPRCHRRRRRHRRGGDGGRAPGDSSRTPRARHHEAHRHIGRADRDQRRAAVSLRRRSQVGATDLPE